MKIAVAGGSGWIGSALARSLLADDHDLVVLTRSIDTPIPAGSRRVQWDGRTPGDWSDEVASAAAVVNFSGAAIAPRRWTTARMRSLRASRIDPTTALVAAMRQSARRPAVFINTSAVGYYGDRGDEPVDEGDAPGHDFLARLAADWEAAARAAEELGVRVVLPRVGVVLGAHGGALRFLSLPFRLRLGGALGTGRQWVPWVYLQDVVGAYRFAVIRTELQGAFNLTAPGIVTNAQLSRSIAAVFGGEPRLRVPGWAIKLALGELAMTVLGGQRATPQMLQRLGYEFHYPALDPALASALGRNLRA